MSANGKAVPASFVFLMTARGTMVDYPNPRAVVAATHPAQTVSQVDGGRLSALAAGGSRNPVEVMLPQGRALVFRERVPSANWTLAFVVPESAAYAQLTALRAGAVGLTVLALLLMLVLILLLANRVTRPLQKLTLVAQQMALGDTDVIGLLPRPSTDELGTLRTSFVAMIDHHREMSEIASAIASGNPTRDIQPKGPNDALGRAFARLSGGLRLTRQDLKENQRLTEALRRSQEEIQTTNAVMRAFLDALPDLITYKDADGRYLGANRAFEEFNGRRESDLIGKTVQEVLPAEERQWAKQADTHVIESGEPLTTEGWITSTRGVPIAVSRTIAPYATPDASRRGVVSITRDITKSKQLEEELREREERARSLFENSLDAILVQDTDGIILDANPAACQLQGRPREELEGMSALELVPPEDQATALGTYTRMLTGEISRVESRTLSATGEVIPVDISASAFEYAGGQAVLLHVRDITDRKRLERELRDGEQQLRTLFDSSFDAIFVHAPDGSVLDVNPAGCRLQGRSRDELLGMRVTDLGPPQYRTDVEQNWSQFFAGGISLVRGYALHVDGTEIPIEITASRIEYDAEPALLMHARDITERVKSEEEMRLASAEIGRLNEQLKAENLRMSAELDITQRLQQMVLPRPSELLSLGGLSVAAYMQPATEVGGDYYDVLSAGNGHGAVKIGIGDVTGHGLESGVLMLMVQMAVQTFRQRERPTPRGFWLW